MIDHKFNFKKASELLKPVIRNTTLIKSDYFSDISNNNVYIKPENLQMTGSFKIRGAYNKISKLNEDEKNRGIITASAGNHAQGVSFSAKTQNIEAIICMPEQTPMIKVDGTLKYGAKVRLQGSNFDQTNEYAMNLSKTQGYTYIPPYDDYDVIEGQGTIAFEILKENPEIDYILVPVGGGGLISGVALCAKEINPKIKIIGVEPKNAASMQKSVKCNKIIKLDSTDTIADGTAVAKVGEKTFEICKDYVDGWISITEDELLESFIELIEKHKLVSEPSGLLSIAAVKKLDFFNKNICCIISGGNIDMSFVSQLIDKGLFVSNRIHTFRLEISNTPGSLEKLLSIFAQTKANIMSIYHDLWGEASRYKNIFVEITAEINGSDHLQKIIEKLQKEGYKID
ncbi:MAG: threonine ammonia-lyase [Peptoniphilaceae bacterium]|nr:threonine ammonia-lyase [Peptoniphilaceae bacterium]MDD7383831.1 threonine ammonia-lyase [Peptoniphilaceae bacterium]MDY3737592.1 threonine ammonia-lyase [Peptoniphilaceae bacterium]